ncbi:Ribosomal protein l9 [Globisporangium polare]
MLATSSKRLAAQLAKRDVPSRAFGHRVSMVLKQDVANLGFRGEEVSVKAGFARNFLYPEKLAVYATEANLEKFKVNKESVDEVVAEKERALKQIIARLTSVELVFKRHTASKQEQSLHSSVTAQNVSDMLEKQHGIVVGVARINLPAPIKTLGTHTVKVRVDDHVESEPVATEGEAPVAAAAAADDEESAAKGASKKQEVKLQVLVTRR